VAWTWSLRLADVLVPAEAVPRADGVALDSETPEPLLAESTPPVIVRPDPTLMPPKTVSVAVGSVYVPLAVTVTAPVCPLTDVTGPYFAACVAKSVIWLAVCVWADGANVDGTPVSPEYGKAAIIAWVWSARLARLEVPAAAAPNADGVASDRLTLPGSPFGPRSPALVTVTIATEPFVTRVEPPDDPSTVTEICDGAPTLTVTSAIGISRV
jgi:hypothetical protein